MTAYTEDPAVLDAWVIRDEEALTGWSENFVSRLRPGHTLLLHGPMGSGKTTLVRHVLKAMGGAEASSPTFSLVNEYQTPRGVVYHFDLYRLETPEELEEIGFEEYLDSGAICMIEWPQLGEGFYDFETTTTIYIEILSTTQRRLTWYKGIAL